MLQNMHKKMTQAQFIDNLAELCDGKDFPKDLLKVIFRIKWSEFKRWPAGYCVVFLGKALFYHMGIMGTSKM